MRRSRKRCYDPCFSNPWCTMVDPLSGTVDRLHSNWNNGDHFKKF